jgi:hypothetical protein
VLGFGHGRHRCAWCAFSRTPTATSNALRPPVPLIRGAPEKLLTTVSAQSHQGDLQKPAGSCRMADLFTTAAPNRHLLGSAEICVFGQFAASICHFGLGLMLRSQRGAVGSNPITSTTGTGPSGRFPAYSAVFNREVRTVHHTGTTAVLHRAGQRRSWRGEIERVTEALEVEAGTRSIDDRPRR